MNPYFGTKFKSQATNATFSSVFLNLLSIFSAHENPPGPRPPRHRSRRKNHPTERSDPGNRVVGSGLSSHVPEKQPGLAVQGQPQRADQAPGERVLTSAIR